MTAARARGSSVVPTSGAIAALAVSVAAVAAIPSSLAVAQTSSDGASGSTVTVVSTPTGAASHETTEGATDALGSDPRVAGGPEPSDVAEVDGDGAAAAVAAAAAAAAPASASAAAALAPASTAGAAAPAPAAGAAAAAAALAHLESPRDIAWQAEVERECERREGMRYASCDGPRRVVVPSDEARERAERLGLGTHATADALWTGAPRPEWVAEAGERHEGLLWPVAAGLFSRGFGAARVHDHVEGTHRGLDVVAAEGAHLRAVDDALVAYADNGVRGLGNVLFLVLGDGSTVIYAHCQALLVAAGERVRRGDLVGLLGHTGLTVRAHLHLEWRREGEPRDPMPQMRERPEWRIRVEEDGEVTWLPVPANRLEPSVPDAPASAPRTGSTGPPSLDARSASEDSDASEASGTGATIAAPVAAPAGAAATRTGELADVVKADVSPPAPPAFILACSLGDDDGEAEEEARR